MNNAKLTQDELQAIKEREEKATAGPWSYSRENSVISAKDDFYDEMDQINHGAIVLHEDGEFIAHARQDIPKLVAEVERLQAELDRLCGLYNEQGFALSNRSHDIYKLRKTLEYYADSRNYQEWRDGYAGSRGTSVEILRDYGRRAEEALRR